MALGSEYDGVYPPEGLEDISGTGKVTAALAQHGFTAGTIRKILGQNYLRVLRQVARG